MSVSKKQIMKNSTPCRLLIDTPAAGDWNMAVDEVLLQGVAGGGGCVWRFYQWSRPTLSLGYFQDLAERERHPPSRNCPVVRRASGGGAIVHDLELTYSFVVPADHALSFGRRRLYDVVHQTLIETLHGFGIKASLFDPPQDTVANSTTANSTLANSTTANSTTANSTPANPPHGGCPFLCFQRRSAGDVIVEEHKIGGSAQRRLGSAVLQHGSVLLDRSKAAPELPGLNQLVGCEISGQLLGDAWGERIEQGLGLVFTADKLTTDELADAQRVAREKYGWAAWTKSRGR